MKINRDYLIDFLRFLAIVLMVFAHANMILGVSGFWINDFGKNLGNFICFALFLFCFGASNYIQTKSKGINAKRTLKRIGWIYLAYIIVAIISLIDSKTFSSIEIFKLFTFQTLPSYGEFLITFILFEVFYFIFYKFLNKLGTNIIILLITSSLSFFIGNILNDYNYGSLTPYTSIIWGKDNYFAFPFLQYLLFFLLGIFYSETFVLQEIRIKKIEVFISLLISSIMFFTALYFYQEPQRWPPNATFRFGNTTLLFFFVLFFLLFEKYLMKFDIFKNTIYVINKYTIHIFYFHIIVLFALRWLNFSYSTIYPFIVTLLILCFFLFINKLKTHNEAILKP